MDAIVGKEETQGINPNAIDAENRSRLEEGCRSRVQSPGKGVGDRAEEVDAEGKVRRGYTNGSGDGAGGRWLGNQGGRGAGESERRRRGCRARWWTKTMAVVAEETGLRRRRRGGGEEQSRESSRDPSLYSENDVGLDKEKKAVDVAPVKEPWHPQYEGYERYLLAAIFLVAYAARFYKLGEPKQVVFDEFHFGKFVNWTLQRKYYFDIHPPLGKLILSLWGWLVGYEPIATFNYDKIGEQMGSTLFYPLRELSAFVGTFVPVLAYRSCKLLGFHPAAASVVAICLALDNLLVIESRLILVDSQLVFFCVLSMYCALVLWRTTRAGTGRRWLWLALTGAASGAAFGIKWTALAFPGIIAVISFFGLHFLEDPLSIGECLFAGVCGIVVYTMPFYIHFRILINSGSGDNFMEKGFRHTLFGNKGFDPDLEKPSFLYNFLYLNRRMFLSNKGISDEHHWKSKWYQWIVNWRGILYFRSFMDDLPGRPYKLVYLFSNPIVTWSAGVAMLLFILSLIFLARYRDTAFLNKTRDSWREFAYIGTFCLTSWLANLLPYILVDRSSFAYHYLPGLYFAEIALGLIINLLPRRLRIFVSLLVIAAIVMAYVHWSPWVYAVPMLEAEHKRRRWLPRWD